MPGSVFLVDTNSRLPRALEAIDPLRGDWLVRRLDPNPDSDRWWPAYWRLAAAWVLICGAIAGGVWFESRPHGSGFLGPNGLLRDMGAWEQYIGLAAWWALILTGRRVLGLLLVELDEDNIAPGVVVHVKDAIGRNGKDCGFSWVLRSLLVVTQLNLFTSLCVLAVCVAGALLAANQLLSDGIATFLSGTPDAPGLLNCCGLAEWWPRHGLEPISLAGAVSLFVVGVLHNYAVLPAARLCAVFAVICKEVSKSEDVRVVPHHPDGTGGLLAIGRTSLFLSLFPLLIGLSISVNIVQSQVRLAQLGRDFAFGADTLSLSMTSLLFYAILAPTMFFLPLVPLRSVMASAKREYLKAAETVMSRANSVHIVSLHKARTAILAAEVSPSPDGQLEAWPQTSIHGAEELDYAIKIYEAAEKMAVWPLDRLTLIRFGGIVTGGLVPLLGPWFEKAAELVKPLLGGN